MRIQQQDDDRSSPVKQEISEALEEFDAVEMVSQRTKTRSKALTARPEGHFRYDPDSVSAREFPKK